MEIGNKIKPTHCFISPNLEFDSQAAHHLSIQININAFSFALLDLLNQEYIALEHFDIENCSNYDSLCEKIDEIIYQHNILQQEFKSSSVAISNHINTLTPKILFQEDIGKEVLNFNHPILKNEQETNDWLRSIQAFNSYIIPSQLERCIKKHFDGIIWKHDSTILIESILNQFKLQEGEKIYLSIQNNYFELIILNGKKLIFFNSFKYKTAEDLIYFVLFTCEQLNLNPEQVPLIIFGEIEEDSKIYQLLFRYVRHIDFTKRNPNYKYSFVLDTLKEHFYYKLLNQHLCVS